MNVNSHELSVVSRLPQSYRWSDNAASKQVELIPVTGLKNELVEQDALIGLKLLSHSSRYNIYAALSELKQQLAQIQIDSEVADWEGEPCLFLYQRDESTALCCLKMAGAAIAEPIQALYPF